MDRHDLTLAVPIEHRVKAWSSIEDKLSRTHFGGASLTDLHDLVGIRLILLFRRDLESACRLVEESLEIAGRQDKAVELTHEQFGYQSVHLIARPPRTWPAAVATDAKYVAQGRERGATDDRAKAGVFLTHAGLVHIILEQEYSEGFYSRIWERAEEDEQGHGARTRRAQEP